MVVKSLIVLFDESVSLRDVKKALGLDYYFICPISFQSRVYFLLDFIGDILSKDEILEFLKRKIGVSEGKMIIYMSGQELSNLDINDYLICEKTSFNINDLLGSVFDGGYDIDKNFFPQLNLIKISANKKDLEHLLICLKAFGPEVLVYSNESDICATKIMGAYPFVLSDFIKVFFTNPGACLSNVFPDCNTLIKRFYANEKEKSLYLILFSKLVTGQIMDRLNGFMLGNSFIRVIKLFENVDVGFYESDPPDAQLPDPPSSISHAFSQESEDDLPEPITLLKKAAKKKPAIDEKLKKYEIVLKIPQLSQEQTVDLKNEIETKYGELCSFSIQMGVCFIIFSNTGAANKFISTHKKEAYFLNLTLIAGNFPIAFTKDNVAEYLNVPANKVSFRKIKTIKKFKDTFSFPEFKVAVESIDDSERIMNLLNQRPQNKSWKQTYAFPLNPNIYRLCSKRRQVIAALLSTYSLVITLRNSMNHADAEEYIAKKIGNIKYLNMPNAKTIKVSFWDQETLTKAINSIDVKGCLILNDDSDSQDFD